MKKAWHLEAEDYGVWRQAWLTLPITKPQVTNLTNQNFSFFINNENPSIQLSASGIIVMIKSKDLIILNEYKFTNVFMYCI